MKAFDGVISAALVAVSKTDRAQLKADYETAVACTGDKENEIKELQETVKRLGIDAGNTKVMNILLRS